MHDRLAPWLKEIVDAGAEVRFHRSNSRFNATMELAEVLKRAKENAGDPPLYIFRIMWGLPSTGQESNFEHRWIPGVVDEFSGDSLNNFRSPHPILASSPYPFFSPMFNKLCTEWTFLSNHHFQHHNC